MADVPCFKPGDRVRMTAKARSLYKQMKCHSGVVVTIHRSGPYMTVKRDNCKQADHYWDMNHWELEMDLIADDEARVRACEHKRQHAHVALTRAEGQNWLRAEVTIRCSDCGGPFRFMGLPEMIPYGDVGLGTTEDGYKAVLPIAMKHGPVEGEAGKMLQAIVQGSVLTGIFFGVGDEGRREFFRVLAFNFCFACGRKLEPGATCECRAPAEHKGMDAADLG